MKNYDLAKIAYDAYVKKAGGVSLTTGDKLPEFDVLKESIQDAWDAAANAVLDHIEALVVTKGTPAGLIIPN